VHIVEKCQRAATTVSGASASLQPALLAIQRDAKAELNRRSQVCAVLAGTGVRVAGKSLERGCGRRPSRSALEVIRVPRLMLRAPPRSENWPGGSCTRVDACFSLSPLKSAREAA